MTTPRFALAAGALLAGLAAAAAQAPAPRQPARPAAQPAAPPAPPPIFPCRTPTETCYLGVVAGGGAILVYTNAKGGQGLGEKPVDVAGPDGAKLDLQPHNGRVVMLLGEFDAKTGLTKAELVEVASPLVSLSIKAQLGGLGGEEDGPPPAASRSGGAPPPRR